MAPPKIPLAYRIVFLYLDPFAALGGAISAHFFPSDYLVGMSPSATASTYSPQTQVVFDQLAATYFLFAFNEAVVLRVTSELRVWKAILFGILLCDAIHLYGSGAAMGWDAFINPWLWRSADWVNLPMLYGLGVMRLAFLFEIGFGSGNKTKES
jgi:hypothetical protein